MNKFFYGRLAANNIKKNARGYVPYMLTCMFSVMTFYIMLSIVYNPNMDKMLGGQTLASILGFGVGVVGFFSAIFLFYTNSFLIKQRKKELALYNILGMAKRHVGRVFLLETLQISVISLIAGLLGGCILGKLVFLLLLKIMEVEIPIDYQFSLDAAAMTVMVYGGIFMAVLLCNLGRISLSNPMEMLAGSRQGEKEPKTKWILAFLGLLTTGIGYYLAITVESPLQALLVFFIAVLLVIVGTYLLFMTGSIALLKQLRRNKSFYYMTSHFMAVSGMLYRMKRNAAGLASICILSTMVLVTISTTVSLQVGVEDVIDRNMPNDVQVKCYRTLGKEEQSALVDQVDSILEENQVKVECVRSYPCGSASGMWEDNRFVPDVSRGLVRMHVIPLDESSMAASYQPLDRNEVLISGDHTVKSDTVMIGGLELKVKDGDSDFVGVPDRGSIEDNYYMLVADRSVLNEIAGEIGKDWFFEHFFVGEDVDENSWDQVEKAIPQLKEDLQKHQKKEVNIYVDDKMSISTDFHATYGGLLFIGVFLGLLFLMMTVLIIYYKQITEGYEDSERYKIMQKVGMSLSEVKRSIRSQILLVFFLPLIVAIFHVAAAFNMMSKLLIALQISTVSLFVISTIGTILIFAVIYVAVYSLTAREYYKLVK